MGQPVNAELLQWASVAAPLIAAVAAVGAVVLGIINRNQMQQIHLTMNSRLDELVKSKKAEGHAEGVEAERVRKP